MGNDTDKRRKKKRDEELNGLYGFTKNGLKNNSGQIIFHVMGFKEGNTHIKFMGIYDGHGEKGKEATELVEQEVKKFITNNKKKFKSLSLMPNSRDVFTKFFGDEFKKIQNIMKKFPDTYNLSGTSCICTLIVDRICYIINIGDSRAVIGGKLIDNIFCVQMSIDHKPTLTDELERIKKFGGEVKSNENGIMRVFKQNEQFPGLTVSRSIGDLIAYIYY